MSEYPNGLRPVSDPPQRGANGDDAVARLLRLAGRRPGVPAEAAAMAREAAHAEWRRAVRAERQRRLFTRGGGALLAAAAVLFLVFGSGLLRRDGAPAPGTPLATLVTATGSVRSLAAEGALAVGAAVATGETLETGDEARAALRLADGTSLRLDAGTRLRLVSGTVFDLDRGAVYVDSGPLPGESLAIRTPLGTARDVGTRFEVRLDGDSPLRVRVREGTVVLSREGTSHTAGAGVELAVSADGTVVERQVALHGEPWGWTLAILPAIDVEGRSLREFLDWAAREGGWELRFADAELAERASTVVLYGSIEGLDLEEATAALLLSSGLRHRLDGAVLLVEPAG